MPPVQYDNVRKIGVTHAIRANLNFLDERLWKRFSARRLELIDTLDLSTKKASEQDEEIRKVADSLRSEFGYGPEYAGDFDKLVRAAIQSVRRNRKRSSRSKPTPKDEDDEGRKKPRLERDLVFETPPGNSPESDSDGGLLKYRFISEISRLNSDSQEDDSYLKAKHFSTFDRSRAAIDSIIQPKVSRKEVRLPPITNLSISQAEPYDAHDPTVRLALLHFFERSKTCAQATSEPTDNLQHLGKAVIASCTAFVFEKAFASSTQTTVEYLREKLQEPAYLARFFREIDPKSASSMSLLDEAAVMSLNILVGGCVSDFGFDAILYPLGEALYQLIYRDYPLILRHSVPFRSCDYTKHENYDSLTSLAAVASGLHQREIPPKKAVTLRYMASKLSLAYPAESSAPPRYNEVMENGKNAFRLADSCEGNMFGLRNLKDGSLVKSDADLERIFRLQDNIDLEIFSLRFPAIPIYEITAAVTANNGAKILLPPPLAQIPPLSQLRSPIDPLNAPKDGSRFKFLSNIEELPPPPPILPKFQPLL